MIVFGDEVPRAIIFRCDISQPNRIDHELSDDTILSGRHAIAECILSVNPNVGQRIDANKAVFDVVGVCRRDTRFGFADQIPVEV